MRRGNERTDRRRHLARWAGKSDEDVIRFLNEIGGQIARAYYAGEISYTFCDGVMNDLWTVLIHDSGLRNSSGS